MPVTLVKSDWTSGALRFRQVTSAGAIYFGEDDTGLDIKFFGATANSYMLWDESADKLIFDGADVRLQDSDILNFGDADDVSLKWDGTNLVMLPVADDAGAFHIGDGTTDFDVKIFVSASTKYVLFDVGNVLLTLEDVDLRLGDNDEIEFGDGADVTIRWDGTDLDILAAADDSVITVGNGTLSFDLKLFGDTTSSYVLWDASEDRLSVIQSNAATTGVETTVSVQQTHTGVGASAEAFESILTSNVALGTYANAIFGKVDLSTSGEVTGLIGVICAEVTMPSADAPAGGEYAAFEAEFNMAGASVNGRPLPVLDINVWGGNETEFDSNGLLFDIGGVSTGDGKFFRTNAVAFNNCDAFLKCRVGGTVYYIPLSDNQAGT